jgi:hypothetical protein
VRERHGVERLRHEAGQRPLPIQQGPHETERHPRWVERLPHGFLRERLRPGHGLREAVQPPLEAVRGSLDGVHIVHDCHREVKGVL